MVSICKRQCFFAFILILGTWAYEVASRELQEPSMSARHEQWMETYGKVYADAAEKERRFEIFKDNVEYIESFNTAGNKPYKLSVNKFADLTNEELKVARNGYRRPLQTRPMKVTSFKYENVTAVPATMDWRKKGAVTPIKDQGQCGKLYHCTKHFPLTSDFMLHAISWLYMYKCYH
jgi:C1A family cysteine protease